MFESLITKLGISQARQQQLSDLVASALLYQDVPESSDPTNQVLQATPLLPGLEMNGLSTLCINIAPGSPLSGLVWLEVTVPQYNAHRNFTESLVRILKAGLGEVLKSTDCFVANLVEIDPERVYDDQEFIGFNLRLKPEDKTYKFTPLEQIRQTLCVAAYVGCLGDVIIKGVNCDDAVDTRVIDRQMAEAVRKAIADEEKANKK